MDTHNGTRMRCLNFRSVFFSFENPFRLSDMLEAGHHHLKLNVPKTQVYCKTGIQVEVDKVRTMAHYQPSISNSKRCFRQMEEIQVGYKQFLVLVAASAGKYKPRHL